MRLQYTSSSSSTSLAVGLSPCLLPGPGSALAGGGCSYCWGCCYGALLFFLWTSAAVTASSSSSSSSTAGGAGATAAVTGAPGSAGGASGAAAAAASHSAAPPLPAAVVAGGALVAAFAAGAGGWVLPSGAGASDCYASPSVGSVQELAQRSRVVIEGKVQQQQGAEGRRKKVVQELNESVTSDRGRGQVAKEQVNGETDKELPSSVVRTESREEQVPATSWITPFPASVTTIIATVPTGVTSDFVTIPSPTKSAASSGPESYLVKVHQVWAVKTGGLAKDSLITVLGNFSSSCLRLKEDSRYIFFMDPTNSSSVFRATFPPLETGRNLKKDVGRVLCRGCASPPKLKEMKTQSVQEGKKLVLKCQAVSEQPSLKFRWFKGEKEIGAKNKPESKPEHIKIRGKKKSSELQINKASSADNGEYKCTVSNQLGNDSVTVNVTIVPSDTTAGPGHLIKCSDKEKTYCVNGGECYVLNGITSSNQFMCKCPNEFTGDRCQNYVMASFYKHLGIEFMEAEELYQKRVLTITGICIALLVVGIMCVVAYCKTKKQRKKLHDRLRQSLRSERNNMVNMANGPHHPNPPPENVQLVNYVSKNVISSEHVIERETETSFSTSHYTSTTHHSTTVTQTPSHSWSNGQSESMISESHSVIVTSSVENSRHTSPTGPRGRLNGIGGPRDCSYLRHARDTPDSYRDSPHSERYVSAMTTPARMSPVEFQTPISPKSPCLEMSPPESSLAVSVPSVAVSPFIEEERPLLLVSPPRLREKRYDLYYHHHHYNQQYNSYHHNPGHDSSSLPPSPLRIVEDEEYETTQEYEPSLEPAKKLVNSRRAKRTKPNGHISNRLELDSDTSSESSTSESETEDERIGEETPFLSIQNPLAASLESASLYRHADSRTNPTSRFSTQEELQARLSSVIANQDPIAV
ncbi:pro-neuregulin-1, membrane-bound isoform isoform X4 [Xenopus laevis]|uniref:Pro-neuregulin-1, membrane-bound isoform n=1 Tax=Xenopus laevis TaxID=8355 RepID=A0A8J1KJ39_XENLA|nr:pro-neuregulin-1, membrane-bound isoform isoform X4 [Xenopus laevis]